MIQKNRLLKVMPVIVAATLLVSCGGSTPSPTPTPSGKTFKLDVNCTNCTVAGETQISGTYNENEEVKLSFINALTTYTLAEDVVATCGDKTLVKDVDYTYSKEDGELKITLKGDTNIAINATNNEPLNSYSWREIKDISKNGQERIFNLGDTKEITVNNITQKVRIIGFDQDVDQDGNKIGITFEFENLLSDENGYCLAAYWNDGYSEGNLDYFNSGIRAALNGVSDKREKPNTNWFQFFGLDEDDGKNRQFSENYNYTSVLNMLPKSLVDALATPSKLIMVYDDTDGDFHELTVNDKLFLLSPREMGYEDPMEIPGYPSQEPNTFTYLFYDGHTSQTEDIRIKHQIEWHKGHRTSPLDMSPGKIFAGYNDEGSTLNSIGANDNVRYGCYYWLRSPYSFGSYDKAWYVDMSGCVIGDTWIPLWDVQTGGLAMAPAFCI